MTYTLGDAAKATGLSKPTISKAIKTGRLSATKNPNGSYSIDPSELHRVYPPVNTISKLSVSSKQVYPSDLLTQLLDSERQERERERQQLQDTITDLRKRLDRSEEAREMLTGELSKLTLMLEDKRDKELPVVVKKSLFDFFR